MIKLYFSKLVDLPDEKFGSCLALLPESLRPNILRYHLMADRKARLLARLILRHCLIEDNAKHLLSKLETDNFGKPYIKEWRHFNISHSGDWVILACAEEKVGADIERLDKWHCENLYDYLHLDEIEYITTAKDRTCAFYYIWTRKEALLKAYGTGLVNELKTINCVQDRLVYQQKTWNFYNVELDAQYKCSICAESAGLPLYLIPFNYENTPI